MIRVEKSGIHGLGAFAAQALRTDEQIGVYAGRRYSASQAERKDWDSLVTYVFGLSDGSLIDASTSAGNATRHINHSCRPNVIAYEEAARRGAIRVVVYALRDIAEGEELFLDYSLSADPCDEPALYQCRCGAEVCRGTMLAMATESRDFK
jgi:SET domain-containing protein